MNASALVSHLICKYAEAIGRDDDSALVAEMIIIDVIMHVNQVSAPHARERLYASIKEGD